MMSKLCDDAATERAHILLKMQQTIGLLQEQMRRQQEFLLSDDVNAFIESLGKNQSMLMEMEKLMQTLHTAAVPHSASPDCMAMEDELKRSFKALQEIEKQTNALANGRLEEYKKNIRDIRLVKKGLRSYLVPFSSADGMYFDKKK